MLDAVEHGMDLPHQEDAALRPIEEKVLVDLPVLTIHITSLKSHIHGKSKIYEIGW